MLHQIALQMICNLSYRHFDLVRSPGNVFVLVVAVLLVLCEANDDNRKCRIISAFETWLQTSYWTIQRWCFVPWLYMSFISTDSLFTIACSIVAVRARLNTTPCWRRPVFITTTETTSSWELAVVNSSVWRHWASLIQVHRIHRAFWLFWSKWWVPEVPYDLFDEEMTSNFLHWTIQRWCFQFTSYLVQYRCIAS